MLWKVNMKVLNVIQTGKGSKEIGITSCSVVTYRTGQSEDSRQNEMPWGDVERRLQHTEQPQQ